MLRAVVVAIAIVGICGVVHAEAPNVPTDAPYIVLSANLDEPNGYGFCLDTQGRGQSDLLHTHSCKPAKADRPRSSRDNDTRFAFDPNTGRVASYPFEGFCMQALLAGNSAVFALLTCSDHPRQKFTYSKADQTLRLAENKERCVSVGAKTLPAGPWVKRLLTLQDCIKVDTSLRQWTVVAE